MARIFTEGFEMGDVLGGGIGTSTVLSLSSSIKVHPFCTKVEPVATETLFILILHTLFTASSIETKSFVL